MTTDVQRLHEAGLEACREWCALSKVPNDDYRTRAGFIAGYAQGNESALESVAPLIEAARAYRDAHVTLMETPDDELKRGACLEARALLQETALHMDESSR